MPKKLTKSELQELKELLLNKETKKEKISKILFDGKQYSIRIPKKFIEEARINYKKDLFKITLVIPAPLSKQNPSVSINLINKK